MNFYQAWQFFQFFKQKAKAENKNIFFSTTGSYGTIFPTEWQDDQESRRGHILTHVIWV